MVRFSCFNAHIHPHKPKKTIESSVGAMHNNLLARSASSKAANLDSFFAKAHAVTEIGGSPNNVTGYVLTGQGRKSEEMESKTTLESDTRVQKNCLLKKSQSLGSELCRESRSFCENDMEDDMDPGFSSDSLDQNGLAVPDGTNYRGESPTSHQEYILQSESAQAGSELVNNKSIFSIGDPQHSDKEGPEDSEPLLFGDCVDEFGNCGPRTSPPIVKSSSLPNMSPPFPASGGCSYKYLALHSRSSKDLHVLCNRWKDDSFLEVGKQVVHEHANNDNISKPGKIDFENSFDDGYDSCNYSAMEKDWILPVTDEVGLETSLQGESSIHRLEELPIEDFKIKRIQEWVNDLQHCGPLEETNELTDTIVPLNRDSTVISGSTAIKVDSKVTPGIEAAKRYIYSLSASATTAQLSNHGLVAIPFLSAFVSLRILNLSGNSIVRMTAGALPRGLHMLNLSKNNISTIEGLRELTRLRVLDLSYNRIFRVGHGLASCSALKELCLAGNKISEVEGLHRLLKLAVLDLRFNKISTAKCLDQLAANYSSLQAVSLEGNPAQKNVGDEQLKKYLQGLLPHLVYFNRQPIKVSTLKDAADRSVRLGMNGHQFDRSLRSDNKTARKVSHGTSSRPSYSSVHGRQGQAVASPKLPRGRNVHLPPLGTKAPANNRQHYLDSGSKLTNFRMELSIRRSRSEGTLAAL